MNQFCALLLVASAGVVFYQIGVMNQTKRMRLEQRRIERNRIEAPQLFLYSPWDKYRANAALN